MLLGIRQNTSCVLGKQGCYQGIVNWCGPHIRSLLVGREVALHLELAVEPESFEEQLAHETMAGGLTVVDAIERIVVEHLEDSVVEALGSRLIKAPRATIHPMYFANRFENLWTLRQRGYSTWYPKVIFSVEKSDPLDVSGVGATGFRLGAISYGSGIRRTYKYKRKELKTQTNHTIQLNRLVISPNTFSRVSRLAAAGDEITQPRIANLTVGFENFVDDRVQGFRAVSFDHVLTGTREFCGCHRQAHASMLSEAKTRAPNSMPYAWPHRVISLLDNASYTDGLCHFCIVDAHGEGAASDWYGAQIQDHYGPYVDLLVRSADMDIRTAKAETKRRLSISRWKREDELYRIVSKLFPTQRIRREASPAWLGQQRLDIYLPELKLAIEHQGEQHYRPVGAFGGEAAFVKAQERDKRKRELCKEHGVEVVDIRFDAPLTLPAIRSRLRRWLDPTHRKLV